MASDSKPTEFISDRKCTTCENHITKIKRLHDGLESFHGGDAEIGEIIDTRVSDNTVIDSLEVAQAAFEVRDSANKVIHHSSETDQHINVAAQFNGTSWKVRALSKVETEK